jgi:protoporphyrinogen oxidase
MVNRPRFNSFSQNHRMHAHSSSPANLDDVLIVGAGPAGLTAAHELTKHSVRPMVLEQSGLVGGIARTEVHHGNRFDIGGHRFYTKVPEVQAFWDEILADDFITVPRLSRIYYDGKFYQYPIEAWNAFANLGPIESARIFASYARWQLLPHPVEETFEQWVTNRFGDRLYRTFFKTYTEKVWGIPCTQIRADWAAQRIKGLSLRSAVTNALFGNSDVKSLIKSFQYPRLGPGMMWEETAHRIVQRGGSVQLHADVTGIRHHHHRVESVIARVHGVESEMPVSHLLSTMPLSQLILQLDPGPPDNVLRAARGLQYRDFLLVGLIVNADNPFPDNWLYIHTPGVRVGRIQNFKNWSAAMVANPGTSSLGMEYFCSEGDDLWTMSDNALVALASREVQHLKLANARDVTDAVVIRQRKAYPVYDGAYSGHLDTIRQYLGTFQNLHTIGRNGMHRYNNQDHSMLTGLLAARSLLGGQHHNLWNINTERSYHEEFRVAST